MVSATYAIPPLRVGEMVWFMSRPNRYMSLVLLKFHVTILYGGAFFYSYLLQWKLDICDGT